MGGVLIMDVWTYGCMDALHVWHSSKPIMHSNTATAAAGRRTSLKVATPLVDREILLVAP